MAAVPLVAIFAVSFLAPVAAFAQGDLAGGVGQLAVQPKKEKIVRQTRPKVVRPTSESAAAEPPPRSKAIRARALVECR